jgi:hypothetical protein
MALPYVGPGGRVRRIPLREATPRSSLIDERRRGLVILIRQGRMRRRGEPLRESLASS